MTTRPTIAVWAESHSPGRGAVIGNTALESGLPWPTESEDLRHFRAVTRNHVLVMGRKTFEALPAALKTAKSTFERPLIILTHEPQSIRANMLGYWRAGTFGTPEDLVRYSRVIYREKGIAVIGGRETIEWMEPVLDQAYVSFIAKPYDGDVLAPFHGQFLMQLFTKEVPLGRSSVGTHFMRYDREVPTPAEDKDIPHGD